MQSSRSEAQTLSPTQDYAHESAQKSVATSERKLSKDSQTSLNQPSVMTRQESKQAEVAIDRANTFDWPTLSSCANVYTVWKLWSEGSVRDGIPALKKFMNEDNRDDSFKLQRWSDYRLSAEHIEQRAAARNQTFASCCSNMEAERQKLNWSMHHFLVKDQAQVPKGTSFICAHCKSLFSTCLQLIHCW